MRRIRPPAFLKTRIHRHVTALPAWARPGQPGDPTDGAKRVLSMARVAVVLLTVVLVGLLGRVVQLQIAPPEPIAKLLNSQHSSTVIRGRRGTILDRRGQLLAVTRVAKRLFVDTALILDRNTFSEHVGYGLGYEPFWVEKTISRRSPNRYIVLDHRLSNQKLERFKELNLPGLAIESVLVRDYPNGPLAGQLIGFVGRDGVGLEGIELAAQDKLASQLGRYQYSRDAYGQPLWVEAESYKPHQDGRSVRLTLDISIQSIAEHHLAEAVSSYGAESGQLLVMEPQTGAILAMAHVPRFDPNDYGASPPANRRNRLVTDVFEPGSIFKPILWAAALHLGVVQPEQRIDCSTRGLHRTSGGRWIRDAHPHGELSWKQVLVQSSNIGMAIIGQKIGAKRMETVVRSFGFGQPTGSGLPGEVSGIVHPLKRWDHYSITSIPMGQEIGVTGLQMTRAFCVFANGGLLPQPTYTTADLANGPPALIRHRVLPHDISIQTRRMLRRVVTEGTGRKADSDMYALFGKTGTAQLPNLEHGGYHDDQYVASFLAGAPLEFPAVVVGCFIHKPDKSIGHYGGTVAAPAVKRVIEESLTYLGIPTEQ